VHAAGAGWVVPLERASWVTVLRDAMGDGAARAVRGPAGRRLVLERFSWPVVAAQLERLYRTLSLAPRPEPSGVVAL
jgi:hypothetical protein